MDVFQSFADPQIGSRQEGALPELYHTPFCSDISEFERLFMHSLL